MTASTSSRAALLAALLLGLGLALGACSSSDTPCAPAAELCDGQDDDCDGTVDDGFDAGAACTVGLGACQASGQKVCTSNGAATICDVAPGTPGAESCNGLDDDCDGATDEGLADCCAPATTRACGAGVGVCVTGTQTCSAARAWGECLDGGGQPVAAPGERLELCNGVDDDCDDEVDELDASDCTLHYRDVDQDGFGFEAICACGPTGQFTATQGLDCDDQNAAMNPGAVEVCNGLDDDCDGQGDEGIPAAGPCTAGIGACEASGSFVCEAGALACSATPSSPSQESCNGLDDNCDGTVDEGLAAQACYTGPAGTAGVGRCAAGTRTCAGGAFTACQGELLPQVELCNGVDDDCDGAVDEGIAASGSCSAGVGVCQASGQLVCQGGTFTCNASPTSPSAESCNGLDDDCNGTVDEVAPQTCYTGPAGTLDVGACHAGTRTCSLGSFGACVGEVLPLFEVCNGVDDDCDGVADEPGTEGCTGRWIDQDGDTFGGGDPLCLCTSVPPHVAVRGGDCSDTQASVNPGAVEVCNGVDDDCDTVVDEGIAPSGTCSAGTGACLRSGQLTCQGGGFTCNAVPGLPSAEFCNGLDDDCNGTVDEVPALNCYSGPVGTDGVGACHQGTQTCSFGAYGACQGEVVPQVEVCNGVDDDCNGQVDETGTAGCTTFYIDNDNDTWGTSSSACLCAATGVFRATRPGDCDDSSAGVSPGAAELCNGRDDDCDTVVDESVPVVACPLQQGVCTGAVMTCSGGAYQACAAAEYGPEYSPVEFPVKDCLDNNCNGVVDEGLPPGPCL